MNYDSVPIQLKAIDQWVTWVYEGDRKVPYNPRSGKRASSTNPQTWAPYDIAVRAAQQRKHSGIGFVFTNDDPFTGIDLDDCIEGGLIATWARDIVDAMSSYSEISPSGTGLKIWVEGKLPANIKTEHIEIYSTARYFTVTGQHLAGTPTTIRNVNGELKRLAEILRTPESEPEPTEQRPHTTARVTDDSYLRQWADRVIESALARVRAAPLGTKHNTLLDMARLLGGLVPLRLADELTLADLLLRATDAHKEDPKTARNTIRDGLAMGMRAPLTLPDPPPQPLFDAEGFACCPVHQTRLDAARNGNGYKCHERDASTASGWCDFWWKGDGYIPPKAASAAEPIIIAGEVIPQTTSIAATPTPRLVLYKLSGLRALPPVTWLVNGEVPAGLTTIICGPSSAGKSFLAVDYALQIARRYPDRAVVYIAPEGGSGYRARVEAWLRYFGGEEPDNLLFILQAVTLLNPQTVSEFITVIRPLNPVMVIVDTLARSMVGGDENSAKDVGLFFYHCDLIRQETGTAIAIVHHTGKAGAYRGSSALYGSVDSWIDLANDDGLITVSCGKAKDWEPFPPRYLRMVEIGESVVLLPSDQVSQRSTKLTEGQRKTLETLALDIFTGPGAKRAELVSATGINEVTMYKILSRLKRDRLIEQSKRGDPYMITAEGLAAIKNYHRDLRQQRDKLSNYPETIEQLSGDASSQLSNYPPPYIRGIVDRKIDSSESEELFEDEQQPTEPVADIQNESPPAHAPARISGARGAFDWAYVRQMYAAQNAAAIRVHCSLNKRDFGEVIEQLEREAGVVPQEFDDDA